MRCGNSTVTVPYRTVPYRICMIPGAVRYGTWYGTVRYAAQRTEPYDTDTVPCGTVPYRYLYRTVQAHKPPCHASREPFRTVPYGTVPYITPILRSDVILKSISPVNQSFFVMVLVSTADVPMMIVRISPNPQHTPEWAKDSYKDLDALPPCTL